jgi:hypothetical protein
LSPLAAGKSTAGRAVQCGVRGRWEWPIAAFRFATEAYSIGPAIKNT